MAEFFSDLFGNGMGLTYLEAFFTTLKITVISTAISYVVGIPLGVAGFFRYMMAVDDEGNAFEPSTDPLLGELREIVKDLKVEAGEQDFGCLRALYTRKDVFGVDLYEEGMGDTIESMVKELYAGPGAVRKTLHKYVTAR